MKTTSACSCAQELLVALQEMFEPRDEHKVMQLDCTRQR